MKTLESCPVCGTKMEKGYVVTEYDQEMGKSITWRTEVKQPRHIQSSWDKFKYKYHGVILNDLEAYRCDNCKIVIISYEEEEKKE